MNHSHNSTIFREDFGNETLFDCWYKPFSLTSVCHEDLKNCFTQDDIAKFDDDDMASLASGMGEAYLQYFWIDLKIIGKSILENK